MKGKIHTLTIIGSAALLVGCGTGSRDGLTDFGTAGGATTGDTGHDSGDDGGDPGDDSGDPGNDPSFDVGNPGDDGGGGGQCHVNPDGDGVAPCMHQAPPDSFDAEVQWAWEGDGSWSQSIVIPLVANLTDDNGDGNIDLCDTPDLVVSVFEQYGDADPNWPGYLYLLDGATGASHGRFESAQVNALSTPALGDIDGDGVSEIVAVESETWAIIAFEHDGTLKWKSPTSWSESAVSAIALADLEGDGDVEILAGNLVLDHTGALVQQLPDAAGQDIWGNATTAADLDGDGDLEVVLGRSAYHHDGTPLFKNTLVAPGYPQVADLDGDGQPEVLVDNANGISLLEHDGTEKFKNLTPTGVAPGLQSWMRPSTIHDFDGDGASEFAVSSQNLYAVYESDASVVWTREVTDLTGITASTAFDFLGDGSAEAMYADEHDLYAFDDQGNPLLAVPRSSGTGTEYPIVADVDNDGSAEIVVVSNEGWFHEQTAPAVQVVRDVQDRWVPTRRIWNQHTYHVTNVREDGTIPAGEEASWTLLNTFRTNAQIEAGGLCKPPEG